MNIPTSTFPISEEHKELIRMIRRKMNTGREVAGARAFLYSEDFVARMLADFENKVRINVAAKMSRA